MIYMRFKGVLKTLADASESLRSVDRILVFNPALDRWALLNPWDSHDCYQYWNDPRHTALCVITADDLSRLPPGFDPDKCEAALIDYVAHRANPAGQVPFTNCFDPAAVITPLPPTENP